MSSKNYCRKSCIWFCRSRFERVDSTVQSKKLTLRGWISHHRNIQSSLYLTYSNYKFDWHTTWISYIHFISDFKKICWFILEEPEHEVDQHVWCVEESVKPLSLLVIEKYKKPNASRKILIVADWRTCGSWVTRNANNWSNGRGNLQTLHEA